MKIKRSRVLTFLVTFTLVVGPLTAANADSESIKGQIQRLMVGSDKSCQVGKPKLGDQSSNESKSKSKGKNESKGKSEDSENNSDKSSLSYQAQKLIDQLTAKNTPASLAASAVLQTAKVAFVTNTATATKTYTDALALALLTCNNMVTSNKNIYDRKVTEAKTTLKAAQLVATTEEAKKAAGVASKLTINSAAIIFKSGAQMTLTKYQSDLTAAANVRKIALVQVNSVLATAIQTARAALA
jgi:hypothetical protein